MTQLVAILIIPIMVAVCFAWLGRGVLHGYMGLFGGAVLLLATSLFKGVLEMGWSLASGELASCSVSEFYKLAGGIGCSPVPVAFCYALMGYGLLNLVVAYASGKKIP